MIKQKFHGRSEELETIQKFLNEKKSDVFFIKGRRRVGKSYLLEEISSKRPFNKNIVNYLGSQKPINKELYELIIKIEQKFNMPEVISSPVFNKIKEINSEDFFNRLLNIVIKRKTMTSLIIDEIQWMGDDGGKEFSIKLKEFWVKLERSNKFKIIITGSSYKFFQEYVSKSDAILRSISSYSPLILQPFTPSEIKKFFFPQYKHHHVLFLYMITGGVSQYLKWLKDTDSNFEYCINSSFFKKDASFLQEVEELLRIDLSDNRQTSAIGVMSELSNKTLNIKEIITRVQKKESISESTIRRILDELIGMGFVSCKTNDGRIINEPLIIEEYDKRYYVSDLYLSFYFSQMHPIKNRIEFNTNQNLFQELLDSKKESLNETKEDKLFVISEFTGNAFELALIQILQKKQVHKLPIFKKLKIEDTDFTVDSYNKSSKDQIDVFIMYKTYNVIKVIECKWISSLGKKTAKSYCEEVVTKKFHNELHSQDRENFYMFTVPIQTRMSQTFKNNDVIILNYKDLFE